MHYVYILRSHKTSRHYVGMTADLMQRVAAHNAGKNASTRHGRPWQLVYSEEFTTKTGAWTRERQIKSYKGGEAFKKLIS